VWGRQSLPAKRFVARGSEPSTRPPPAKRLVARGSEPSARQPPSANHFNAHNSEPPARQAERSGKRGCWGEPPSAKSLVARGNEPPTKQAERCGKRGCGVDSSHLPSASLPAVVSRLQDKPSAARSWDAGTAAPICDKKFFKVCYKAVIIRESASARRLAERQRMAPQAHPSAEWEFGGSTPKCFKCTT
jgi:hypothetical protein